MFLWEPALQWRFVYYITNIEFRKVNGAFYIKKTARVSGVFPVACMDEYPANLLRLVLSRLMGYT